MRDKIPVLIPRDWNDMLEVFFHHNHMKKGRGGQGKGDIIAKALCQYEPLIKVIKDHNYQIPECEEK